MAYAELVDDDFLRAIDEIRGIPDELGVESYSATVRVISWTGARVGLGTRTVTDTPIRVGAGQSKAHVARVTSKDVIASGGLYTAQDMRIGPLTPGYAGGGVAAATLDPSTSARPTEVYFVLAGPGIPAGGVLYARVGAEMDSSTQYFVVVRSTGRPATPA